MTGATGAVGSRLAAELLKDPDIQIELMVRGASQQAAEERMRRILAYWHVDTCDPDIAARVRVVCGDIERTDLGIETTDYSRLAKQLTHVVHCAADIKLNLPEADAKRVNLGGTENIVRLARCCAERGRFRRLSYLSTAEVAGDFDGVVKEEFLTHYSRRFLNTYELAKAQAEEWLRGIGESGLPITIFRPSMVVGDSRTGQITRFGTFYYLLSDLVLSPRFAFMPGTRHFLIDTVPVDFVAEAIRCLLDDPLATGRVFNLTAGLKQALPLPIFVRQAKAVVEQALGTVCRPPTLIPAAPVYWLLKAARAVSGGTLRRTIDRQLLLLAFFFLKVRFDNSGALAALRPHAVEMPALMDYLPVLCRYYAEHRQGRGGAPRELR